MQILLRHWHCILPVIGIIIAMIFMRDKSGKKEQCEYEEAIVQNNIEERDLS